MATAFALMKSIFPASTRCWCGCLLFLLVLTASPVAQADSSGCTEDTPTKETTSPSLPDEGLKAYIDPVTGELLSEPPPGEESETPEAAQAEPTVPEPTVRTLPDGTLMLDLSEQPPEELRAEMVDGKLVTCHRPGSKKPVQDE